MQKNGKIQQLIIDPALEFAVLRERSECVLAGKEGNTITSPTRTDLLSGKHLEVKASDARFNLPKRKTTS